VLKYFRAHGFVRITTNIYASLSQGLELLFLFAFAFGRHSSAALVHLGFLVTLPLLMICYGRRIGYPWVGVSAAIFVYAAPVVGMDGSIAYNDVAVAAVLFCIFYLLDIWDETRIPQLLIPIGILAGWAYAIKYTAALAVPFALGFVIWRLGRDRKTLLRPVLIVGGMAALMIAPWMIKNALWVDNPFSPFANSLFPNPFVHISMEQSYRAFLRSYAIKSYTQIPLDLTVRGTELTGLFGPLFLLTPLMFFAARKRAGRRLLFAALLFALPYATNIGSRFLIPAVPFVSLALALSLADIPGLPVFLPAVFALAHAVSVWPSVLDKYCDQYAWRIDEAPWAAALRIEPDYSFLWRKLFPVYPMAQKIETSIPRGKSVFEFSESGTAYTDHILLGRYTSALGETTGDILWNPLFSDMQSRVLETFQFTARTVSKLRIVQTANMGPGIWSVAEVRLFNKGQELPRTGDWRLTAHPNPWDVQMAFDSSPATRWRSWQAGGPGMYIEVDLATRRELDAVTVLTSQDSRAARMQLDVEDDNGRWITIVPKPVESTVQQDLNLRRLATEEVKRRGIEYIVVGDSDIGASDYRLYAPLWGLEPLPAIGDMRLYKIR
jgi:F5/8 type C domain/Dolichyl-phosphate-mannose-protein mannosyltransferase